MLEDFGAQLRKTVPFLLVVWALPLLLLLVIVIVAVAAHVNPGDFTREPQVVGHVPFYAGIESMAGGLVWSATAALCFFTWALLRRRPINRTPVAFFLYWALVTTNLLVDDTLQLHELIYPQYLGIPQELVQLTYISLTLYGLIRFRDYILRHTDYLILAGALACFATSVGVDFFEEQIEVVLRGLRIVLEDGSKLLGIVAWLGYFWRCARTEITQTI